MATDSHVWDRYTAWWHGAFAFMVLLALGSVATDSGPARPRVIAAGCVLALAIWYVAMDVRQRRRISHRRWDLVAASGTVALTLAAFLADPATAVLLFIVYPLLFGYLEDLRRSIPAVTALTVGVATINAAHAGWSAGGTAVAIGAGAVSLAFSVGFGVWISRIIEQSRDRAGLIAKLEATREELAEAHREAGAAAERQRLALEIHDTLAQGFTSLVMLVQAAEGEVGRHDDQVRRYLSLAERTARENLDEARSLVTQLTPTPLQTASLADAIARLTERFADETPVSATFELAGTPRPLAASADVVLVRVVQESLTNVRRHAAASKLTVRLTYLDDEVTVEVVDDGCGFSPVQADGFGLRGMRERVGQVGGAVTVDSAPGHGTTVGVRLR